MLYTPMLPEAASGSLEPRHVVVPLRMMCPHSELLLGRLTALDPEQRVATIEAGAEPLAVHYEQAVLALGSFPRALPIPGLAEHGLGFKDLADAIQLRNHVLRRLEAAAAENDRQRAEAHLTFVFVGAGYAGVEALAELSDLVRDALRYYPQFQRPRTRWVLVDAAPKILPEIPTRLGDYAAKQLSGRGVEIHIVDDARLASGRARSSLSGGRADPDAHARVDRRRARRTRSCASSASRRRARRGSRRLDCCASRARRACGRSATARACRTSSRPAPDPPTSQHALRQARRLAKNLRGDPKPYRFRMLGQVATLGRYKGIALVFGRPAARLHRLVRDADVPPLPATALLEEATRRDRLDGRAPLPAGHRRAGHARPPEAARR